MAADELIRLVESLDAPFGLERSVKITHGSLVDDRCLISLGRGAFGDDAAAGVARMGRALQLPDGFEAELPRVLEGADVVHFGYETAAGQPVHKIYFEYVTRVRGAMASPRRDPVLVHLAFKWTPGRPASGVVTRYNWVPYRTPGELEQRLEALVPAREAPRAHRCALALLARIGACGEEIEPLLMEVEERGNPRRSCDLNVYDAELRIAEIADLLETAVADFAVPEARRRLVFDRAAGRTVGHLSAGLARDGREFVTIYFGVEAH